MPTILQSRENKGGGGVRQCRALFRLSDPPCSVERMTEWYIRKTGPLCKPKTRNSVRAERKGAPRLKRTSRARSLARNHECSLSQNGLCKAPLRNIRPPNAFSMLV